MILDDRDARNGIGVTERLVLSVKFEPAHNAESVIAD